MKKYDFTYKVAEKIANEMYKKGWRKKDEILTKFVSDLKVLFESNKAIIRIIDDLYKKYLEDKEI